MLFPIDTAELAFLTEAGSRGPPRRDAVFAATVIEGTAGARAGARDPASARAIDATPREARWGAARGASRVSDAAVVNAQIRVAQSPPLLLSAPRFFRERGPTDPHASRSDPPRPPFSSFPSPRPPVIRRSAPKGARPLFHDDASSSLGSDEDLDSTVEDIFLDAFDSIDGTGLTRDAPGEVGGAPPSFHDLSPQAQVASVVADGGVPFELCSQSWTQSRHANRMEELLNATKERVAREAKIDRAAARRERRRRSMEGGGAAEPAEMSLYDQAKGVIGRMQLGQDITKFELPATFLTPFSACQASEDVLTIISGTELANAEGWSALTDPSSSAESRFLAVLRLYLDMESLRAEEGTAGGTKSAFVLPPMKKPINSVLGETHRTRVGELEMVAEQVSHHPPITCWEIDHTRAGVKITGNLSPKPIFHGTSVQVALRGTILFEIASTGEAYATSIPDLYIRFFGLGGGYNENVGRVRFERVSAGTTGDSRALWADLHFKARGNAGWKSKANRLDATVYRSSEGGSSVGGLGAGGGLGFGFLEHFGSVDAATKAKAAKWAAKNPARVEGVEAVMSLKGHYNAEVFDVATGESFWQAAKRLQRNPIAATVPIDLETESHLVWGDLISAIVREDWKKANAAKKRVEVAQRVLMKEIKEGRKRWTPRLFARDQKTDLGCVGGMYTLREGVRENPPECDKEWHDMIAKSVFQDL